MHRRDVTPLLVAAPVLAILAWWTFAGGGYSPTVWYPGAIALGLLAAAATAGRGLRSPRGRALRVALGALTAYTLWSFLSVIWADSPGDAVEGSHRTLLYLLAFGVMALAPWRRVSLLLALGGWVVVVTVAGVVTLLRLQGDNALDLLIDARLSSPMGYMNADPALWTMGALPALGLAARSRTPLVLRPLLVAAAALLLQLSVLSQSRGWLFALPLIALLALVMARDRLRLAVLSAPVALAAAVSTGDLLAPFDIGGSRDPAEVAVPLQAGLEEAARAAALGTALALVLAAIVVAVERYALPERARGLGRPVGAALAAIAIVGGVGAGLLATEGRPVDRLERAWDDFTQFEDTGVGESSRFVQLGSTRYDFWRVATELVGEHPVLGIGQDNFAEEFVRRRESTEETRWVHSIELRLVTHTGFVGLLLFALGLGAIVVASGVARKGRVTRPEVALGLFPGVVWLVQGSVDWFWEYPALSVAAFAFAGAAAALGTREATAGSPRGRPAARPLRLGAGALGALVGGVLLVWLGTAFLARRNVALGRDVAASRPQLALDRFARARSLDPFAQEPPLLEGLLAARRRDLPRAREALREAVERSPEDWFARLELALLPDQPDARELLERARALNPDEAVIRQALRRLGGPRPLTQEEAAEVFRTRVARRLGR